MNKNTIYAVVDIETTGTNLKKGDRMIQFGCVLVQKNKIINSFSFDINPGMAIPKAITELTGITNRQIRKATYFEDVAATIYAILQDTVFVAHNINFDLPFINSELERVGYPALMIKGIDTVQLSQILLPTSPSFKLKDLSQYLNLTHENPHHADSDAHVTAELFIYLLKRLEEIPSETLFEINRLSSFLLRDTKELFTDAYGIKQANQERLSDEQHIVGGLVLQRSKQQTFNLINYEYPENETDKKKIIEPQLSWRSEQAKMMDLIANHLKSRKRTLIIEAPTGIGKTLGYLIPAAYYAQKQKQIVISSATTLLQTQLMNQSLPLLNKLLPFRTSAISLKGSNHYINLAEFKKELTQKETSGQIALMKIRILVWLAATKTGDLDELRLSSYQNPIFNQIKHRGVGSLMLTDQFFEVDFINVLYKQVESTSIVFTNHAFLMKHPDLFNSDRTINTPELIVDEAQHLADVALQANKGRIRFWKIINLCDSLLTSIQSSQKFSFNNLMEINFLTVGENRQLLADIRKLRESIDTLIRQFTREYGRRINRNAVNKNETNDKALILKSTELADLINRNKIAIESVSKMVLLLEKSDGILQNRYIAAKKQQQIGRDENQLLNRVHRFFKQLFTELEVWNVFDQNETKLNEKVLWLSFPINGQTDKMQFEFSLADSTHFLSDSIYRHFNHLTFTGATLLLPGNKNYIVDQLDIQEDNYKIEKLGSPFDYSKQAKLYIANDSIDVRSSKEMYESYLADSIYQLIKAQRRQTLILFNSLETIANVYELLAKKGLHIDRELLVQGITGRPEKLTKRFLLGKDAILLGTGSFWEGIDLPNDRLELLIVTRLPFESPESLNVKAKEKEFEGQGRDVFSEYSLPRATMRLKQGFGRLIRTSTDKGVMVVLDSRLVNQSYGEQMIGVLPDKLPIFNEPLSDIIDNLNEFFDLS
ncbi:helicase C-terminal domain-containing protein [Dellaglioa algida]|uniref:helicase C-terminal domain-containing protein n=1 Tax=Dellaglioa algida TaxID=105612 RepID=UPI000BCD82D5|nr:helicase C-terminal domain-containing protein [Dellaglioa algida]MDK1718636.1 exonuclease domain-containing protein [Dellaglioa algida]MDK1729640.1 exonuclease domain-containing protein [Dellaglioa algida]MDK1742249.1 exonuclease domain-containing protein [Dellaglioa algida]SOB49464.1 ATP-dependent helicase, DinG family [Dellaglioa algida]